MVLVDPSRERVLDEKAAPAEQVHLLGQGLARSHVPEGGLDVHEGGLAPRGLPDGPLREDDPTDDCSGHLDETLVTPQVRGPPAHLPAVHGGHERLVQRRVGGHPAPVALGHSGRVFGHGVGVRRVEELAFQPEGGAVVDEVQNDLQTQCLQTVDHPVRPVPGEPPRRRVDPVPGEPGSCRVRGVVWLRRVVAEACPNVLLETSWSPGYDIVWMVSELGARRVVFGRSIPLRNSP